MEIIGGAEDTDVEIIGGAEEMAVPFALALSPGPFRHRESPSPRRLHDLSNFEELQLAQSNHKAGGIQIQRDEFAWLFNRLLECVKEIRCSNLFF